MALVRPLQQPLIYASSVERVAAFQQYAALVALPEIFMADGATSGDGDGVGVLWDCLPPISESPVH